MIAKVDEATIEGLIEGYQKEQQLYRSMLEITRMQSEGLRGGGDVREFISLLRKKEDLIRSIDKLEAGLQPIKRAWQDLPDDVRRDAGRKTTQLNRLLDGIVVLIEKIIQEERENKKVLEARRSELGDDVKLIDRGRRMHRAFSGTSAPRFVDARR